MIDWERFTARGGPDAEATVRAIVEDIAQALDAGLEPAAYRCIVLIGGYGRSEGGVVVTDGRERPHNNLDLLVVARTGHDPQTLKQRAEQLLAPLEAKHGIGMDVGCVSERSLRGAPCLLMWHDMRFGHKRLLGDSRFVASLDRFSADRIVPSDVLNLIVNRGTLLVINELLLSLSDPETHRRTVIKHWIKAIIGYGDAWLFFLGKYHHSYVEKQRRMRTCDAIPADFRALYDDAMEFRFRPRYADHDSTDLRAHNRSLLGRLEGAHLACERLRLGRRELSWNDYPKAAFRGVVGDGGIGLRSLARKGRAAVRGRRLPRIPGVGSSLGAALATPAQRLAVAFPVVAYDVDDPGLREMAAHIVSTSRRDADGLRRAYLRTWGEHGDVNFLLSLRRLGVSLEEAAP